MGRWARGKNLTTDGHRGTRMKGAAIRILIRVPRCPSVVPTLLPPEPRRPRPNELWSIARARRNEPIWGPGQSASSRPIGELGRNFRPQGFGAPARYPRETNPLARAE